jgi:hypothetical protein
LHISILDINFDYLVVIVLYSTNISPETTRQIKMIVPPPPPSIDILRLWIYCISGVVTVIVLMFVVCYMVFRQECSGMAARRKAKALQYARLHEWQQQVNAFPNLTHRPASDILVELGIGQHQPQP